ncbi:hypothetical protein B0J17DRAFT_730104, partial [Rhizoctonia solani]
MRDHFDNPKRKKERNLKTTKLNPNFCFSKLREKFAIYDHSFRQGFHLHLHLPCHFLTQLGPQQALSWLAKQQFKAGCTELQASTKAQSIIIQFFVGDALSFFRALYQYNTTSNPQTGEFASPWRANAIGLTAGITSSPPSPATFDVIDSSDLPTGLGLFNILLATQPLHLRAPFKLCRTHCMGRTK